MAEDEYVAATQASLGALISKPKMTEKYLKKPPFRFLHDIVMEVSRTTNFGQGLYTTEECDAANLGDKAAKVEFLNKAINCVAFALGEKIDVSANKIVAGLEADKTNAWLQRMHTAATTCAGPKSDDAVQRVLGGESNAAPKKEKKEKKAEEAPAEGAAPPPPPAEDPAPAADEEAKKEEEKRKRAEKKKREEEKRRKAEEEAAAAKAAEDAQAAQAQAATAANAEDEEAEKQRQREEEKKRQKEEERRKRKQQQADEDQQRQAAEAQQAAASQQADAEAAMASQLANAEAQRRQMEDEADPIASKPGSAAQPNRPMSVDPLGDGGQGGPEAMRQAGAPEGAIGDEMGGGVPMRAERPRTAGRKPPKVISKVKTTQDESGSLGVAAAPVFIADGAQDDDDDTFEAPQSAPGMAVSNIATNEGGQHGKLVQDLLGEKKREEEKERLRKEEEDTREEVTEEQKGIRMGKLKRKKDHGSHSMNDIDVTKLGEAIQQLCQAANPLGKSIDLVHQDIANMGKELDHWKNEYREASEQYTQELKNTDELLQPLYQQIAELDDKISEQKTKIRNSRSRISKNDLKVQSLLESVVMAK